MTNQEIGIMLSGLQLQMNNMQKTQVLIMKRLGMIDDAKEKEMMGIIGKSRSSIEAASNDIIKG